MEIHTETEGTALIISVSGRVDSSNAREFEHALKSILESEQTTVITDLQELTYISSAGLRVLLLIAKQVWKNEGKFALCALAEPIREVFEISGFDKIVQINGSRQDAMEAFEKA